MKISATITCIGFFILVCVIAGIPGPPAYPDSLRAAALSPGLLPEHGADQNQKQDVPPKGQAQISVAVELVNLQAELGIIPAAGSGVRAKPYTYEVHKGLFVIEADLPDAPEYTIRISGSPTWEVPEDDRTFSVNLSMLRLLRRE